MKIIVSGHSQGADHAEKISVDRQVHGIVVFEGGRDTCEKIEIVRDPIPRVVRKTVAADEYQCLPVNRTSRTGATQAQDTYLFPYYLTRLCYACDKLTCP